MPFVFEAAALLAAGVHPYGMSTLIGLSSWQPKAILKIKGIVLSGKEKVALKKNSVKMPLGA